MRRRKTIIVSAACVLLAIGMAAFWPGEREPEYDGKNLSEWLDAAGKSFWAVDEMPIPKPMHFDENASAEVKQAVKAVRVIGTNALPWLLEWAAEDHEKWQNWVLKVSEKLPRFLHAYPVSLSIVRKSGRKQRDAIVGFAILGEKAAPAVPELATLLENSKSQSCRMQALFCLGVLEKNARPALPCLKKHAKTNAARERFWTGLAIRNIEGDYSENGSNDW